eukprot:839395-Pelagomonas_calceolata.AAC.3
MSWTDRCKRGLTPLAVTHFKPHISCTGSSMESCCSSQQNPKMPGFLTQLVSSLCHGSEDLRTRRGAASLSQLQLSGVTGCYCAWRQAIGWIRSNATNR